MAVAIVTGASRGLGRALARALAADGWGVVLDARTGADLSRVAADLDSSRTIALAGDVTDPAHRRALVTAAEELGGPDVLINNASYLGPSPQPQLQSYPPQELARVYAVNVLAPHDLIRLSLPSLVSRSGVVVNISSDAAAEPYEGWGGYGSSKAALDHMSAILAAEEPALRVYAMDPGDMRTQMHAAAFPGEDISDRPEPESVVPALLRLLDERPPSGRYRAADLLLPATR
jgi:NAD(P)-dependent dehydrogenase (short-subunit alcohol dehydrogenase family)